jgi:MFS family permease
MTAKNRKIPARVGAWVLLGLGLLHFAVLAPRLVYPDPVRAYPFMDGDSQEWIANGLAMAGVDVHGTARPPLVPLVLMVLHRTGTLGWFPVINLLCFLLLAGVVGRMAKRFYAPRTAFVLALCVLGNYSLQSLSLDFMADFMAATLLASAVLLFLSAERDPRMYLPAGLAAGLSAVTQQAALLLPVPLGAVLLVFRRGHGRSRWTWIGAAAFAVFPLSWFLWKWLSFGTMGDVGPSHWGLLRPHLTGLGFYVFGAAGMLGMPLLLLFAGGALILTVPAMRRAGEAAILGTLICLGVFFVFLYDFNARRFLLYLVPFMLVAAGAALDRIKGSVPFWTLSAAAVLWSLCPLPARGNDPRFMALWPLPPVYAEAGCERAPTGSAILRAGRTRLVRGTAEDLLRHSPWSRTLRAWRERPPGATAAAPPGAEGGRALYLHGGERPVDRASVIFGLGNALERKIKIVPHSFLAPWWPALNPRILGSVGEHTFARADLAPLPGGLLLIWDRTDPPPATDAPPPAPLPPRQEALGSARDILAWMERPTHYMALVPESGAGASEALFLVLLGDVRNMFVIPPERKAETTDFVAAFPKTDGRRFGPLRVEKALVLGRPSLLVYY